MAGTTGTHSDEFARISSGEHNVAISAEHEVFGPSKRFTNKSQTSNPSQGGGINRPLKGKGSSSKGYSGSAQ